MPSSCQTDFPFFTSGWVYSTHVLWWILKIPFINESWAWMPENQQINKEITAKQQNTNKNKQTQNPIKTTWEGTTLTTNKTTNNWETNIYSHIHTYINVCTETRRHVIHTTYARTWLLPLQHIMLIMNKFRQQQHWTQTQPQSKKSGFKPYHTGCTGRQNTQSQRCKGAAPDDQQRHTPITNVG